MLNAKIEDAFNSQLNAEFYSSYLYLSMSAYLESLNLKGIAHWMQMQAQEEHLHVMKFFDFINDRGGKVRLTQIDAPMTEWSSPAAAMEAASEHERKISQAINKLVDLAASESDHASHAFLQWFVTEQVEEEATIEEITAKLKLAGDGGAALLLVDQELGQRAVPTATA